MREILFRGKTYDGEWVEGSLHIEYGETSKDGKRKTDYRILGMRGECRYIIPETVGQYTGLTDKNDNKIFEGDVLAWNDNELDTNGELFEDEISVVKFSEETLTFVKSYEDPFDDVTLDSCDKSYIKVIGNIHDNPELLKGRC